MKPNFQNPPEIGNNKQIQEFGTKEYQAFYGMYISATGTTPITYQWLKDGIEVSGATNDTIIFPSLAFNDTGVYVCIARNAYGYDTSFSCTLSITTGDSIAPEILNGKQIFHSANANVDSLYYMYIKAIGTEPLLYQWFKDGDSLAGETDDSLVIAALAYADSGYYTCIVSNDFGADTSLNDTMKFVIANNPPVWSVDTMHVSIYENEACTLILSDSCADPDGDSIMYSMYVQLPATDTIITDSYVYTPSFNDAGVYDIVIKASDGNSSDSVVLHLTVLNKNRAPEFMDSLPDDNYYVNEGGLLTIDFKAVDPDNDSVFYLLLNNDLPRTVTFTDSQLVWQSTNDDSGYYAVEIAASDGEDTTIAPAITIAVGDVNRPPVIAIDTLDQGDTVTIKEMDTLKLTVTVSDPDQGNLPVLLSPANIPVGSSFDTATGLFSWVPAFSVSNGLTNQVFENVTFFASDNVNAFGHDTFYIDIEVLDSNSAPVWNTSSSSITVQECDTAQFDFMSMYEKDNEDDAVTFSCSKGGVDQTAGLWTWVTGFSDAGAADSVVTISASDDHTPPAVSDFLLTVSVQDSTPPVTLTNLDSDYRSIWFSWTASSDPDFESYKIYYSTTPGVTESSQAGNTITTSTKTTDTINGLADSTTYYIRVFTYNTKGSKNGSNEITMQTAVLGNPVITVNVPTITGDSSYLYETSPSISGTASSVAGIASVTAQIDGNGVTTTGLSNWSFTMDPSVYTKKAWHTVSITVTDSASKSTTKSFYVFLRPALAKPEVPTLASTSRTITLTWTLLSNCDRYCIYRSDNGASGVFSMISDTTGTSFKDSILAVNKEYWYKILGYYAVAGGAFARDSSVFSDAINIKTKNWFERTYNIKMNAQSIVQLSDQGYIITGRDSMQYLRIDESGDSLWIKYNGIARDGRQVKIGPNNEIITVGLSSTDYNFFAMKMNENGDTASGNGWSKVLNTGGSSGEFFYSVNFINNNYYFSGMADSLTIVKMDEDGTLISPFPMKYQDSYWKGSGYPSSIVTTDGNIVTATRVYDINNNKRLGLIKTSSDGTLIWTKTTDIDTTTLGNTPCIRETDDEGFLVVYLSKEIRKFDFYGGLQWVKTLPTNLYIDNDNSFQKTLDGNFIVSDFEYVGSVSNCRLTKMSQSGEIIWQKTFSRLTNDWAHTVFPTADGGYILAGQRLQGSEYKVLIIKTDANGDVGE